MTLCIKYNNIDFNKLTLNKKKKFYNNSTVIYYPLNYNYDYNLNKKLYILTDWIDIDEYSYKGNNLTFDFVNNDLDMIFNKIKNMITINHIFNSNNKNNNIVTVISDNDSDSDADDKPKKKISNNKNNNIVTVISDNDSDSDADDKPKKIISNNKNNNHSESDSNDDYKQKKIKKINNKNNNISDSDSDSVSDSDSDSDSDDDDKPKKNIKKSKILDNYDVNFNNISKKNVLDIINNKINDDINDNADDKPTTNIKKSNILDNLINLDKNVDNLNEDIKKYTLNFNNKSSIKLIPSKKSGMEEYELNKKENYTEIKRYFPTINKKNTNYKIVGKFLLYINVFYFPYTTLKDIKIHIKSGELKYDKTFVKNDILKSKGVYDDKIKIEI